MHPVRIGGIAEKASVELIVRDFYTFKLTDDARLQPYYNPETMETNIPGLYLAGVVCGGMNTHSWFIENSRVHAELIVRNIKGNP